MSATAPATPVPRVTAPSFRAMKEARRPIVMLTAYDYHAARLVDGAGVDGILVGDSLGMTMLGHSSTLPVTMDDMIRATAAVSRATTHALVVGDMPFMSYAADYAEGMRNAGRFIAEGGAQAVKVENASAATLDLVSGLADAGIPAMGHVGLTPQSVNTLGGYRTQGKDVASATLAVADALALEEAGAFAIVLECVPAELARRISELLTIPTIGIGAGAGCDGQIQVYHDLLGLGVFVPKHAKRYAEIGEAISGAVSAYAGEVRDGSFPGEAQSTHLPEGVLEEVDAVIEGAEAMDDLDEGLLP
jgi:3-methyl-2-oxobutanoate hydroxymethyltransferase